MSHLTLSRQRTIDGPGGFDRNTRSIPRLEVQQSGNDSVMMLPPNAQSSSEKCSRLLKLTRLLDSRLHGLSSVGRAGVLFAGHVNAAAGVADR